MIMILSLMRQGGQVWDRQDITSQQRPDHNQYTAESAPWQLAAATMAAATLLQHCRRTQPRNTTQTLHGRMQKVAMYHHT
jgi:hypothetical protein